MKRKKVKRNLQRELEHRRDGLAYLLKVIEDPTAGARIVGFKVCQVCGEIGEYGGLWGSMARHQMRRDRDGNRVKCEGSFQAPGHDTNAEDSGVRYCEVCRESIPLSRVVWVGWKSPLCKKCRAAFGRHAEPEEWGEMLGKFIRKRADFHPIIEAEQAQRWGTDGYTGLIRWRHRYKALGDPFEED
jgi:hypothetical protein